MSQAAIENVGFEYVDVRLSQSASRRFNRSDRDMSPLLIDGARSVLIVDRHTLSSSPAYRASQLFTDSGRESCIRKKMEDWAWRNVPVCTEPGIGQLGNVWPECVGWSITSNEFHRIEPSFEPTAPRVLGVGELTMLTPQVEFSHINELE